MTSSNENIFRVIGPLCGEITDHRWIPLIKAGDPELGCFIWSAPEQTVDSRDAYDLRRHRPHYDVTIMSTTIQVVVILPSDESQYCLFAHASLRSLACFASMMTSLYLCHSSCRQWPYLRVHWNWLYVSILFTLFLFQSKSNRQILF